MEEYATKNEINLSEIGSSLEFCQGVKNEFCKGCLFAVYGDDCIKHQNKAAADTLISLAQLNIKQNKELKRLADDVLTLINASRWIPIEEQKPCDYVSVLGCMTDAEQFPAVRECFHTDNGFYFPALGEIHPVSHWKPMPVKLEVTHNAQM